VGRNLPTFLEHDLANLSAVLPSGREFIRPERNSIAFSKKLLRLAGMLGVYVTFLVQSCSLTHGNNTSRSAMRERSTNEPLCKVCSILGLFESLLYFSPREAAILARSWES